MKNKFVYDYILELCGDSDLAEIAASLPDIIEVPAGKTLLEAGQRNDHICLVISGMVRGYYIDEEGNDITKCFSMEKDWCLSYNYLTELPCPFFIETVEDSVLAQFDIHDLNRVKTEYPILAEKSGEIIARTMMGSEKRIYSFSSMEAKERYLLLQKERPELIKRAKQEHIASYLGITPSSLSRLKRNIYSKQNI